jgi:hypothetical protein
MTDIKLITSLPLDPGITSWVRAVRTVEPGQGLP